MVELEAIVLAGGKATRLGQICKHAPKAMMEFNGVAFLEYLVSWLEVNSCRVVVSTGHNANPIIRLFKNKAWQERGVSVLQETTPLGTGGAIRFCLNSTQSQILFVCNGDTVLDLDLGVVLQYHKRNQHPVTAIVTRNEGVPNQGAIKVENGLVTEFDESGESYTLHASTSYYRASSTGCYFFDRRIILDFFPADTNCSLEREILPHLVKNHVVYAFDNGRRFFGDFGTPERLAWLQKNSSIITKIYSPASGEVKQQAKYS